MKRNDKNRIVRATLEELKKSGIKGTQLDVLAKKLRISKKTFYQLFSNKQQLLAEAIAAEFRSVMDDLSIIADLEMSKKDKLGSSLMLISQRLFEGCYEIKTELSSHPALQYEFFRFRDQLIEYLTNTYFSGREDGNRVLLRSFMDFMISCASHQAGQSTELHFREYVIPFYLEAWDSPGNDEREVAEIQETNDKRT